MQTIQHLYALHCRLNRKVNIAQIEQILTFEITSENFQNTRVVMSKIMQNLVALIELSENAEVKPLKGGNMILNRFCIDEDAAFELSGVDYLNKYSWPLASEKSREFEAERKVKGKD